MRLSAARRLLYGGRPDAADAVLNTAEGPLPDRPDCLALRAEIALQQRDYRTACRLFGDLAEICRDDGDGTAIAQAGLGTAQAALGSLDAAAAAFFEAIKHGAIDSRVWLGLAQTLFALDAWHVLRALADRARAGEIADAMTIRALNALSAIASFTRDDPEQSRNEIGRMLEKGEDSQQRARDLKVWYESKQSGFGPRTVGERKALLGVISYHDYLTKLMNYRLAHPELFDASEGPALHIVGDSHALSAAHMVLSIDRTRYRAVSHTVIGAKAWHLAKGLSPEENFQRASCRHLIKTLPEAAPVIAMFGEIDCRADEGLFPYLKARPDLSPDSQCRDLTRAYVAFLSETLGSGRRVWVCGVPAPDPAQVRKAGPDGRAFTELVRTFNQCLSDAVRVAGFGLLDIYAATANAKGMATERWYFDGVHLAPELWAALLKADAAELAAG